MKRSKYLNKDEVIVLRNTIENWALKDAKKKQRTGQLTWMLVDTALSTGLRVSELARIRVKNIHWKRNFITIQRSKRKLPVKDELAISPEFKQHLKEYLGGRKTGKLFVGKRGNLTAQGLQQIWKRAIKRAGLPKELSIHSARHTVAVHLLKKTKNLKQVQKQLGHLSIETTANMYADISFEDMKDGVTGLYS